ncbi:bifunctional diaminohydroxyphosphoribosylaminopyrimidine deaminase/5-amino-6-(5-phosphoribosylamino)uracil reductase RibD [Candidatus Photodesmus katoptron]|uniref:bifunctional diaminohydroxyphosphoribosylaminopyrimidine deaminase/5-amino-6-(5-phosphoribosylamino)uracil reductase RibD n=1 Tax=Candidatus Photodesmus anomalopis TaxID=28176 RepID=UPI0005592EC4|nr:bifunctional diaminohydroxyphosphoribosylaminopyrimidine deaminase/5-amino-6-(5-phosphoribosylamino)uracil reductase RibD [Candidatus Photodesmus katoptron]
MKQFSYVDHQMMLRAIELAKRGFYTTDPNPNVGCVIMKDGKIVGEGFHYQAGSYHAEIHALNVAGHQAIGATVYVTLEPCSYYGKTPACVKALIKAKVIKVVCAMQDPNPKVSGRGILILKKSGIEVEVGLLQSDAEALNVGFIKRMKTGMPFIRLKMAASIDGKTALFNGRSQWITSVHARRDVQGFRARSSAILSTSKTVINDNASLNVRWSELPESIRAHLPQSKVRQPLRVILDYSEKLHDNLNLFKTFGGPLFIVNSLPGNINIPININKQFDLVRMLMFLAKEHSINELWVEAGQTLANSLIKLDLIDELVLYLAPKIMGNDSLGLFGELSIKKISDILELRFSDIRQIGEDIRIIATIKSKKNSNSVDF